MAMVSNKVIEKHGIPMTEVSGSVAASSSRRNEFILRAVHDPARVSLGSVGHPRQHFGDY